MRNVLKSAPAPACSKSVLLSDLTVYVNLSRETCVLFILNKLHGLRQDRFNLHVSR